MLKKTKTYQDSLDYARDYYQTLFNLSGIHLTKSELNLIAFTSVKGTLSSPPIMDEFLERFKIAKANVYNMLGRLQRKDEETNRPPLLVKDKERKIRVLPSIQQDFTKPITLQIEFNVAPKS